jgi:hypothetical protein
MNEESGMIREQETVSGRGRRRYPARRRREWKEERR